MQADSFIKTSRHEEVVREYQETVHHYRDAFTQLEQTLNASFSVMGIVNDASRLLKQGKEITFLPTREDNERARQAGLHLNKMQEYIVTMQKEGIPATACLEFSRRILDANVLGSKEIFTMQ